MVLVCEKGRMMVGLGRERGRSLPLAREEEEGMVRMVEVWLMGRLVLVLLGVGLGLLQRELSSCLMAT